MKSKFVTDDHRSAGPFDCLGFSRSGGNQWSQQVEPHLRIRSLNSNREICARLKEFLQSVLGIAFYACLGTTFGEDDLAVQPSSYLPEYPDQVTATKRAITNDERPSQVERNVFRFHFA